MHSFYRGLVQPYPLFSNLIKLSFRSWHLLIHESFTTGEVSFEHRAEELGDILTLLANFEESGTGIRHEVGLAALGIDSNDSAAPTYINLIFALSLMGDMSTNRQGQATTRCSRVLFVPRAILSYSVLSYFFFLFSKAFFCSLANLRSTFFTSSAGGRFSGTIPRCTSISRTAALLAICSWLIRLSP